MTVYQEASYLLKLLIPLASQQLLPITWVAGKSGSELIFSGSQPHTDWTFLQLRKGLFFFLPWLLLLLHNAHCQAPLPEGLLASPLELSFYLDQSAPSKIRQVRGSHVLGGTVILSPYLDTSALQDSFPPQTTLLTHLLWLPMACQIKI